MIGGVISILLIVTLMVLLVQQRRRADSAIKAAYSAGYAAAITRVSKGVHDARADLAEQDPSGDHPGPVSAL